jgi:hypothetical protein
VSFDRCHGRHDNLDRGCDHSAGEVPLRAPVVRTPRPGSEDDVGPEERHESDQKGDHRFRHVTVRSD